MYDLGGKKIFVAGHRGMAGSAIVRRLQSEPCTVLTATRQELDLTRQTDVENWFKNHQPHVVFLAAAKVGGILDNMTYPVDYLQANLQIEINVIDAAWRAGVEKLVFLGSSCIYPKDAAQPIREDALLTAPLEPTNEWYAVAKIAGIKLCQAYRTQYGADFIAVMPTNLYGPHDNYDLRTGHVMAALIRKIHAAKMADYPAVEIWGSGTPRREFMYADDLADALVFLAKHYSDAAPINIGTGADLTVMELAALIKDVIGYSGDFTLDKTKPDGVKQKLMDNSRLIALGWQPATDLRRGIEQAYAWFLANAARAGRVDKN